MQKPSEFSKGGRRIGVNGNEVTAHMTAVIVEKLIKSGLAEKQAEETALNVMDEMRDQFAGQNVYFPKNHHSAISARDIEIYERHSRNEITIRQIVDEYGISVQWAYSILRTVRDKKKRERDEAHRAAEHERWKREN